MSLFKVSNSVNTNVLESLIPRAMFSRNLVYALGSNILGQLGVDPVLSLNNVPNITAAAQIACGTDHSFILLTDGSLLASGDNSSGQLGLPANTTTFQVVPDICNITYISSNGNNSFAVTIDGKLYACGQNLSGSLGFDNADTYTTFTLAPGIDNVVKIANSKQHTVALLSNGTVISCGNNSNGQLGLGNTTNTSTFTAVEGVDNIKQIACCDSSTILLATSGILYACGNNTYGQLGFASTDNTTFQQIPGITGVKSISAGLSHVAAVTNSGSVYVWGRNNFGQLGAGLALSNKTMTPRQITAIINAKAVYCAYNSTNVLLTNGTVLACGDNSSKQLGVSPSANNSRFNTVLGADRIKYISGGDKHQLMIKQLV
jgi:alpha-tubulin suppressor-like RCC1 family protein